MVMASTPSIAKIPLSKLASQEALPKKLTIASDSNDIVIWMVPVEEAMPSLPLFMQ